MIKNTKYSLENTRVPLIDEKEVSKVKEVIKVKKRGVPEKLKQTKVFRLKLHQSGPR
jgi:hypothetical protein